MPDGRDRPVARRAALAVATVLGVGLVPVVPGTFGSAAGVIIAWAAVLAFGPWGVPALAVIATVVGVWAAHSVARDLGNTDPGCVVIDEVAGQAVALAFLPWSPFHVIAGFILFRCFDIIKPPPIRAIERLPGGVGIVADDLVAGAMANVSVRLLAMFAPVVLGGA